MNIKSIDFFTQAFDRVEQLSCTTNEYFMSELVGQTVLHVGCADSMYYNKDSNLHISLSKLTTKIDGLDIDRETLAVLENDCPGDYFSDIKRVYARDYDAVIIPEVIEHVLDVGSFVKSICKLRTKKFYVTAPYIGLYNSHISINGDAYRECVHPDHKAWYSPYTLINSLRLLIDSVSDFGHVECKILHGSSVMVIVEVV